MDEDSQARAQLNLLRADGHDVVAIGELAKNGTPDPQVFDLAQSLQTVGIHGGPRGLEPRTKGL